MISLGNVLIVDDSTVCREMLATLLAPYSDQTLVAGSGREAIEILEQPGAIDLVLTDVVMDDGDGFEVLEHVAKMGASAPQVLMLTAFPREQALERALELGAKAYLHKPTTVRKILNAVGDHGMSQRRELNTRWRCPGKAFLVEGEVDGDGLVSWDLYNVGHTGAFLETKCPLPIDTEMDLLIVAGGRKAHVRAQVVRVQEPSWINVGGVGVKFIGSSEDLERFLEGACQHLEPEEDYEEDFG
jgi:CheY-like chemotaxis protein